MKILDACCGSKMFWYDKNNEHTTFMDIRRETLTTLDRGRERIIDVNPDIIADFTDMPFDDNEFDLVVFDPPHLVQAGQNSWLAKKYGKLDKDKWPEIIKGGFDECIRVLKPTGTLVFKWNEEQITFGDVLRVVGRNPIFGDKRGKTRWVVFTKGV